MKIALLDTRSPRGACINKDFMGGYGWAFSAGRTFPAKLINGVKKIGEKLPIMSFGYIAALLAREGHSVEYRENECPDSSIVIMQSSMVEHNFEMDWARSLKKAGKIVGFIGPFSSAMPGMFLPDCDFVIKGEPEDAMLRISRGLKPHGVIESPPIADLDALPFPDWGVFPHKEYSYVPALRERPFFPVLSSRGCPFGCDYCPYIVSYEWRKRSVDNVLDEIGYLIDKFGMKAMLFRDPIFTADMERSAAIARGILSRGYKIKWACETRLDKTDKELLAVMHKAGLRVMNVGIESADETIIKRASRKPVAIRHQEEMIAYCDNIGIRVTAFYMLGMPDDTADSIAGTIKYAKKLNTHVAQFFIFTPFPGTKYYERIKQDITEKEWEKFDCYTPVFKHRNLKPDEILRLKEKAFVSYYYRPAWAVKLVDRIFKDMKKL